MARSPVLAAGGIVLRPEKTPLIAVVRLRKRDEWVLPKGKLNDGETPRAAAKREVLEETGHDVSVHEFLGTLVYPSGSRSKVVHYWRMAAGNKPVRELMQDVRAVDWLPLNAAVERLSRNYEQVFLANVGPIALKAASVADAARRKAKQPAPEKRRARRVAPPVTPAPVREIAAAATPLSEPVPEVVDASPMELPVSLHPSALGGEAARDTAAISAIEPMQDEPVEVMEEAVEADADAEVTESEIITEPATVMGETVDADAMADLMESETITELAEPGAEDVATPVTAETDTGNPIGTMVQKMRHWLRRAA
jgi:8-oxo-dGTP diphosphatase